jgi:RNA polymerase sigma-70 factor (ECF subfamily)
MGAAHRRGDQEALAEAFTYYRSRLRRMVLLRLDRRLQGRVDASDILQEAYLDAARRADEYAVNPTLPLFL